MAKRKLLTRKQLKVKTKIESYKRQAKKLRATNAFGDLFKPSEGVDLRSPASWKPSVKARITKYAKELGPLLAGETKTKRYFRPDHLATAIEVSPQEKRLPGQRAALFPVDDIREKVDISFDSRHRIRVFRGGIEELKINFDMDSFVRDPEGELARVLDQAPGQFFKFVTGAHESKNTYNAVDMANELTRMLVMYDPSEKDLGDFLYGIKAYPGLRSAKRLRKRSDKHVEIVTKRQHERLRVLSKQKHAMTQAQMRSFRATGRTGRVK